MKLAVVGATGEVGRMMVRILQDRNVEPKKVTFYASSRSAGSAVEFRGKRTCQS